MAAPPTLADLHRLPGASTYRIANKAILAARKALKLQRPFELEFQNWGPQNAVYTWYKALQNPNIHTLHLRKERQAPFFHEFIVVRLKDGTYWRIDRRQLQDEPTPINCIQEQGVPAFDTIEQVTGMGSFLGLDPLLAAASDCMVELEFKKDVDVGLVLRICRAIKEHPKANVYTLQRYNCFFFAQTMLMCTACGASDWAGWGEPIGNGPSPWKSPNAPLDEKWSDMDNARRLEGFNWNPTESFHHEWVELSKQSNAVVHASPLLMHADHCNYCLESQEPDRQRSLSSEINRLKHELVDYWDKEYRRLLNEAYRMNHGKFVDSGVWGIIKANKAEEDCKTMLPDKLAVIQADWDTYSQERLGKLLDTVGKILDPTKACEAWYEDPDEWGLEWNCKGGGPVKPAKEKWEQDINNFIKAEFTNLKARLETQASRLHHMLGSRCDKCCQTIQSSFQVHEAAMRARMESFEQAMTIKLRELDEHEFLKPTQPGTDPSGKLLPDQATVFSKQTKRTFGTAVSSKISKVTKRATKIRNRMRRLFKGSHQLESVDIMQMERRIGVFLNRHGDNVQTYKPWLKCTSEGVQKDMKNGMNEIWACVIR
ncbi:unnamed protein product [Rhizoctonia solani]|uniref:Uncharacterized protein n=1 Tax=Rhizoctonia solani TaxID=456999 RepID=A0A8H3AXH2_9AGAM|nr:unnamed protein product [Rhizoctonia solani]